MSIPPEVLFDRFFREFRQELGGDYQGRFNLEALESPEDRQLLARLQTGLNYALSNEREVPEHKEHPPFYVDFIASKIPNALAFRYEMYSFIGITVPLIEKMLETCTQLSRSHAIVSVIGVSSEADDGLRVILFRMLLFFVVTHEYTHHVHGHFFSTALDSSPISEVLSDSECGSLEGQIREAAADAYAAFHIMANWLDGVERTPAIDLLKLQASTVTMQDEALFSCFVVAVGGYMLLRPPPTLSGDSVYKLQHPPQAARMDSLMQAAVGWCSQYRPVLQAWMTNARFLMLMNTVAEVIWASHGEWNRQWAEQMDFLRSLEGAAYLHALRTGLDRYRASL
jgi:hypothetical protein